MQGKSETQGKGDEENQLCAGMKVHVSGDGDGADGRVGVIKKVWRSGRCSVVFDDGSLRNLTPQSMRVIQ